ncbi:fumarylacetoacetate hydrolase family protein [Nakamurella flavida]|uniref:Fumarylacetoacetate hydrolase family protein n=1 Tax=Nakamurella flavida TaxID=363630 RepID=A0A939C778_9ACTN|nr:fumarylacetoacetate hydrolase family protein [Nakamurella flavida]MBM9477887.1 fumarylacetoacetate hydrolase family protein [Nakamurella flavida]MDP9778399.1 2-keto-4-pentenoate hydratase/2-oxohepta-3-ene-1,7-dioic acid hydratase in catechol pathway [Nakamurella flavida]
MSLPVRRPGKVIAVGLNYRDHAGESAVEPPVAPITFAKYVTCLVPDGASIVIPRGVDEVDWEAELAVVIGRPALNVSVDDALDFVSGYTCMNDVSARRIQREEGQWSRAKSFDTFGPIGPRLIPASEIPDPQSLGIVSRVNGERMQNADTSQMIFSVAELISRLSLGTTLEEGDVISTGTPAGVGAFRATPVFLTDGDVVEVEIDGIGVLRNPVRQA